MDLKIIGGIRAGVTTFFYPKDNSKDFPNLNNLIEELRSKDTHGYISELIKKDLSNSYVRVEVICDRQGFWLKPHCDIKEKLISCLLFANPFKEDENLGTDFYDEKLNKVKTVPYKNNYGYFFTSGPNTWHGMEKKEIKKERRCLQNTLTSERYGICLILDAFRNASTSAEFICKISAI